MKADTVIYAKNLLTCSPSGLRYGKKLQNVGYIEDGAVVIKDGKILAIGKKGEFPDLDVESEYSVKTVLPPLVDSHTHLMFAGDRTDEYIDKAQGVPYLEILKRGGGILKTVMATRAASDEELIQSAVERSDRMLRHGTGLAEVKSGYGLTTEDELRMLRLYKKVAELTPLELVPTFMGAHAVPSEYADNRERYISMLCEEMLPAIAEEKLAEFTDIFCEEGAFSIAETEKIIQKSLELSIEVRVHAEQFNSLGGTLLAWKYGGRSADHLLKLSEADMDQLAFGKTVCTFMPTSEFFMNIREYGKIRTAIDKNVPVALATDFNAGSCLSESLPQTMSIAILQMQLLPEEAITAATVNPAYSLNRSATHGSIEVGRDADLLFIDCDNWKEWLYHVGVNMVTAMMKNGEFIFID